MRRIDRTLRNPSRPSRVRHNIPEQLEGRRLLASTPFDVPVVPDGQTSLTLHPVESVAPNQATRVSFGVPFPKGFVTDLSRVRLLAAGGAEKAVSVQALTPWRDLGTFADLNSVRSALVQTDVSFPDSDGDGDADPVQLSVEWGRAGRSVPALAPVGVRSTWVPVNDASFPAAHNVYEPKAYALFSADWYGRSMLKARTQPSGTENDPAFASYENYFLNFGKTAVNDVDPRVTSANRVNYLGDKDPWLYDRAMTLYQLAFKAGSVQFLREAHRASQFYANHVNGSGYFDMASGDVKYVYGENIATNYWLTGDDRLPGVHQRMIPAFDGFTAAYSGQFWTERNAGYKLLGYTTGFELLGGAALGQKARDTFSAYVNMQNNPYGGAPNNGLLMHSSEDHGEGGTELIASPWMSVLLLDAAERYYVHSGDARVKSFVTRMADGINRIGESMYYGTFNGRSVLLPYYLAGPGLTADQHMQDVGSDVEHGTDVSKIFALAYFFTRADGSPSSTYLGRFNELTNTGDAAFDNWYRPSGPQSGQTAYRLTPPRKFGWWFKTTADNDYLVAGDIGAPVPPPPSSTVQFSNPTYTAGEAAGTFNVTVTRSGATTAAATVGYATSNGTATAGSDYAAASGTLSFAPGELSKTFSVAITNDTAVEPNETVNLSLSAASGATLGSQQTAVFTITNDDDAPPPPATVQFSGATYSASEGAGTVNITVTRTGTTTGAATVAYATSNGTAAAGSDYAAASGTLSFAAGETSKTFAVALIDDTLVEPNETVNLALSSPSGAVLGGQGTAVLTITNNDTSPPPTTTAPLARFTFDEGSGTTASGGAVSGSVSGATWVPGRSGSALSFDGVNDMVRVAGTSSLALTNAVSVEAWIRPASTAAWQTVVMKERPGGLTYALFRSTNTTASSATLRNGGARDVHTDGPVLALNTWSHLAFTYDGQTARVYLNGTQAASQAVAGPLTGGDGALSIGGNAVWASEFFNGVIDDVFVYGRALTQAEIQADMNSATPPPPPPPAPTVSFASATYAASETGGSAVVTVTRAGDLSAASTVAYATSNGSAAAGSDYAAASGTLSFAAGESSKTFSVQLINDTAVESDETVNLALSAPSGATLGTRGTAVLTISSEDVTPPPQPGGPVARFAFDEGSGTTVGGGGVSGTVSGATWVAGRSGSALRFDGVNDFVRVAGASSLALTGAVTVEAWVNPASTATWQTVVMKERPGGLTYALYRSSGTATPSATVRNGGTRDLHTYGSTLPLNAWSHLAMTYDGQRVTMYVNGNAVSSSAVAGPLTSGDGPLSIGGNSVWSSEFFNGVIDDVFVYGRALSPTEIQRDMNGGQAATVASTSFTPAPAVRKESVARRGDLVAPVPSSDDLLTARKTLEAGSSLLDELTTMM